MSLYLCVYAGDREVEGVEVGPYADFNTFRATVSRELEAGAAGSRYPTLISHSDCDGEWPAGACADLRDELASIARAMKERPAGGFPSDWQREVARAGGLEPRNAFECFMDVDGKFLIERLQGLVGVALENDLPILFQ